MNHPSEKYPQLAESMKNKTLTSGLNLQEFVNRHIASPQMAELDSITARTLPND